MVCNKWQGFSWFYFFNFFAALDKNQVVWYKKGGDCFNMAFTMIHQELAPSQLNMIEMAFVANATLN